MVFSPSRLRYFIAAILILTLYKANSQIVTKQLYLSDPSQVLDRIDPVTSVDGTTAQTTTLSTLSTSIGVDATTSSQTTASSMTFNHTTGSGTNRLLLVGVATGSTTRTQSNAPTVSSVTYGGTPLTLVGTRTELGTRVRIYIYRMTNPPSGTASVVITTAYSSPLFAGATTFTGVNQTTPLGVFNSSSVDIPAGLPGGDTTISLSGISSATNELIYDVVAVDAESVLSITPSIGQTQRWNLQNSSGIATAGCSTKTGAISSTVSWSWSGDQQAAIGAVSIKPAAPATSVTFTQSPALCSPLTIKASQPIIVTNFVSIISGSIPASPNITAVLKYGATNIITLSNPTYSGGLLTWTGALVSDVTVPSGQAIALQVTTSQPGVGFTIDYDSQTKPSKIEFKTSTFIDISSYNAYNAPYPGGSVITSAEAGSMVYLRAVVTDPFGAYDITDLSIDNQGTPVNAADMATTSCSKIYEYALFTPSTVASYTYDATAKEGLENTVTDSESLNLDVTAGKIDFDGTDDYIDFGNVHNLSGSFSLEAWVLQEGSAGIKTVISKSNVSSGNERGYQLTIVGGIPTLKFFDNSGNTVLNISTSPYTLNNNKWHHLATTFDGTTAKLYVDGIELASGNPSSAIGYGSESFLLGATYYGDTPSSPTYFFDGFMDEIRIWNLALTTQQIHEMMNQEIEQNATFVQGAVLQTDISNNLLWSHLEAYYPLDNYVANDVSANDYYGLRKNINTNQEQSAPLPYSTKDGTGDWNDTTVDTPWTYGDTVWNHPNATGIDGSPIDWNIVVTNHNIDINNHVEVLGLIVESNIIKVNGTTDILTGNDTGYALTVSKYLKLDGKIDLEGGSQLVQGLGSVLDVTSSGTLERDQQGTADTYTYNYWSSPVGISNNSTNNNGYKLTDIFQGISFLTSGYDGNPSPISIADYWIWKFNNQVNDYSQWQHVRSTGTLLAGEGFTMKGPGTGSIITPQNYVLLGKPNNGDIDLNITADNDYLIGNPYPSALDANQFILDNDATIGGTGSTTGTLYFWQHWGGGSHLSAEYEGGYATYTLAGGTPAPFVGIPPPGLLKTPERFIPIAQGFFVTAETTGTINFNNGQRVFQNEEASNSLFIKSIKTKKNELLANTTAEDTRTKLRLHFNSVNSVSRQLLVTVDSLTTLGKDWGYDALCKDVLMDDMYWLIDEDEYTIQAIDKIAKETALPLGIHVKSDGLNTITLDAIENESDNLDVFIHDKELNIYHNLKQGHYEVFLLSGEYFNRFEITFSNSETLNVTDVDVNDSIEVYYSNEKQGIFIENPSSKFIESINIYNILGQSLLKFEINNNESHSEYNLRKIETGTYILKMNTEFGTQSKKVVIQ